MSKSKPQTFSAQGSASHEALESFRITLRTLIAARWVLLLILVGVGFAGRIFPGADLEGMQWFDGQANAIPTMITVLVWSGLNVAATLYLGGLARFGNLAAGFHLVIDTVGIALLLAWSGGASNPFTILFFVPITLATQVSPRWTWIVAGASVLWFGALFLTIPTVDSSMHAHHMQGGTHFSGHLRGMWIAVGLSGLLITYFVHRIATALSAQKQEILRLRETAFRDRELARIGSLAAGAAHELGTPLGTLAILADEFDLMNETERQQATNVMRAEVSRCKGIVNAMATPEIRAHALRGADVEPWSIKELTSDVDDPYVHYDFSAASHLISIAPLTALRSIVSELVANAKTASPANTIVRVSGRTSEAELELEVADQGMGMNDEIVHSATMPFFSTKHDSNHMGLGLFLVEAQVRSLGGKLKIRSTPHRGTSVTVILPRVAS